MKKSASAVSVIGGADGPSSIFFKKNAKLTLKQKIQRAKNKIYHPNKLEFTIPYTYRFYKTLLHLFYLHFLRQ